MHGKQAPRPPGGRRAAAVALAGAGLVLIYLALAASRTSVPSIVPVNRDARTVASARGSTLGERARGAGYEVARVVWPATPQPTLVRMRAVSIPQPTEEATAAAAEIPTMAEPPTPTAIPPRTEVITYQVQPGDNLWLIAQRFNLDQDTLAWANPEVEANPDQLRIGQELAIPPVDGVLHTVKAGETLAGIAQRYQVDVQQILAYEPNGIADAASLKVGQRLMVPGGVKPPPPRPTAAPKAAAQPAATSSGARLMIPAGAPAVPVDAPAQPGRFIWPTQGIITQGYGKWHGAIDIANRLGTPVVAADAGTVTFAGWSGGLGNAIQIDHGDGFATTYAHLDSISVQVGQVVAKGDEIGRMGTTGHSTGPHLHLILTYQGGIINPLDYLPER